MSPLLTRLRAELADVRRKWGLVIPTDALRPMETAAELMAELDARLARLEGTGSPGMPAEAFGEVET